MTKKTNLQRKITAIVLALVTVFSMIPATDVSAAEVISSTYYGGGAIADHTYTVYSSTSWTNAIGTLYYNEGYTVLMQDQPMGYLWIEYSTPSGPKRGYIQVPVDDAAARGDAVAQVAVNSTVYYGRPDYSGTYGPYQVAGYVYSGEFVAIWAKEDDWAYIEYNISGGKRKRGYVKYSNLTVYNRPGIYPDFPSSNVPWVEYQSGRQYVYSGPTSMYPTIGYVENENVTVFDQYWQDGDTFVKYIEYSTSSGTKSGFLLY